MMRARSGSFRLALGLVLLASCDEAPTPPPAPAVVAEAPAAKAVDAPPAEAVAAPAASAAVIEAAAAVSAPSAAAIVAPPANAAPLAVTTAQPAPAAAPSAVAAASATPPAEPAAAPAPVASVTSPATGNDSFGVWLQSAGTVKVGQQSSVQVVLMPKGDFHCNESYPYKFALGAAPAGVTYPSPVVRKEGMNIAPKRGLMSVPFVATAAGDQRIAGKFSFSVCNATQCVVDSRELAVTVKVE